MIPETSRTVVHFITSGAYSNFFVDLARNLGRCRWELVIGSLGPAGALHESLREYGIRSFAMGCTRRSNYPMATLRLARLLRRWHVQVFHSHLFEASLVGLAAARLAGTPVRLMTRHHADATLLSGSRRALWVDRVTGRHLAPHIVAISGAVEGALRRIDHVGESKISSIPLGFDWDRIRPSERAAAIRREWGGAGGPVLCSVGRLDSLKGHDVLVRAFAGADLPETARLLIAGAGPWEGRLRAVIGECGEAGRVHLLGHREDVYDVMAASDLVVHPSFSEAQNQVIIEALALARPVVATTVGAAEDVVVPGRTGWLVPPRDQGALVRAIREALADPGRATAYARAGQQLVHEAYPIARMIERYDALYATLLGAGRRATRCCP